LTAAIEISLDKKAFSVELRSTCLNYGDKAILDYFSLLVPAGAKISLLGENSSGKSTILKVMAGLVKPESGQVLIFGQDTAKLSRLGLDRLRRRVGMQFQAGAMFDSMTVMDNLALAGRECSRGRRLEKIGQDRILDLLDRVGLARAAKLRPSELSGGMRKRAALARALIADPELALFDDPTAGLDPITASLIINLLRELSSRHKAAMILATSDLDVARRFSSDLILIRKGKIAARGGLEDLAASADPYVVKYLSRFKLVGQAASGEG
jgi:phospholipid/cholesterol/gamma-HCH transport system ATP-binding protein